ncbi:hypothetical protein J7E70_29435 [Variovorax paradoxus]|nr:hypothetical protein [Variovorax paradoxus]MBT2304554.1 hypothetical protein [Variovorax paradoxus]
MSFQDEPKNPRLSINNKYKRRLNSLSLAVSDFLFHAEMKLDPAVAGRIYKRAEIEEIVAKCQELAALLPDPADAMIGPPVREDLLDILEQTKDDTTALIAEAEAFFKNLSADEWEELRSEYNKPAGPAK